MCGEHDGQYFRILGSVGSSPRVRGTHVRHRRAEGVHGIIPACAGNTAPRMIKRASSRDHPRVCGEHMGTLHVSDAAVGSSPRVRGTPVFSPSVCVRFGIIPACAGNTRVLALRLREVRDHPRVCGEHSAGLSARQTAVGSSPRVRGTHGQLGVLHHDVGIIPACAGNTPRSSSCSARRRDHPRVCGEHEFSASSSAIRAGSSPRVRGTPHRRAAEGARRGIIPACAGNTERPGSAITTTWDHPRVCGEHTP